MTTAVALPPPVVPTRRPAKPRLNVVSTPPSDHTPAKVSAAVSPPTRRAAPTGSAALLEPDELNLDSIALHLAAISKRPLLSAQRVRVLSAEKGLWVQHRQALRAQARGQNVEGPQCTSSDLARSRRAFDELVESNLPLVVWVMRRWPVHSVQRPNQSEWQDHMQAGCEGLMRACELHDPARGTFATYAVPWVRQAISEQVRLDCPIQVPRERLEEGRRHDRLLETLTDRLGRHPLPEEITQALLSDVAWLARHQTRLSVAEQTSPKRRQAELQTLAEIEVARVQTLPAGVASLNVRSDADAAEMGDMLADPASLDDDLVTDDLLACEQADQLDALLREHCTRTERLVVRLRWGLGGETPRTYRQVAAKLGISAESVRQMEKEVLALIRYDQRLLAMREQLA